MPQAAPSTAKTTSVTPLSLELPPDPASQPPRPSSGQRHVLEFEKPLSRLEQQILELENLQTTKGVDYTKELRQLRNNYTSLLRLRRKVYATPEDYELNRVTPAVSADDEVERSRRLHQNHLENVPAFLVLSLLYAAVDRGGRPSLVWRTRYAARDARRSAKALGATAGMSGALAATRARGLARRAGGAVGESVGNAAWRASTAASDAGRSVRRTARTARREARLAARAVQVGRRLPF